MFQDTMAYVTQRMQALCTEHNHRHGVKLRGKILVYIQPQRFSQQDSLVTNSTHLDVKVKRTFGMRFNTRRFHPKRSSLNDVDLSLFSVSASQAI